MKKGHESHFSGFAWEVNLIYYENQNKQNLPVILESTWKSILSTTSLISKIFSLNSKVLGLAKEKFWQGHWTHKGIFLFFSFILKREKFTCNISQQERCNNFWWKFLTKTSLSHTKFSEKVFAIYLVYFKCTSSINHIKTSIKKL